MKGKLFSSVLLAILICIAFFQVAYGQHLMQWDMLGITFPWRYFISECLHECILPLWNPYLNLGFPQGADPQTWYPVSALLSLIFGYDLWVLHAEFILHLLIAAFGFRYLMKTMGIRKESTLLLFSLAYTCSGFFISNAQFMGWIVSAAWIPYILSSCLLFFRTFRWIFMIQLILTFFMLLTGGYPGLFIITAYFVLFTGIYHIVRQAVSGWKTVSAPRLSLQIVAGIILFFSLSAIVLHCSFEIRDFIYRNRLTVEKTMMGAISSESLISVMYPFAVVNQMEELGNADVSLVNSYFGIFSIAFIALAFYQRNYRSLLFSFAGIIFFLIALGNVFPLRSLLYSLPFFDTFRFPAIFRLFGILFFLLSAATVFDQTDFNNEKKTGRIFLLIALLQLPVILFLLPLQETIHLILKKNLRFFIFDSTLIQRVEVQAVMIFLIYLLAASIIFFVKKRQGIFLCALFVLELLLFSQMNGGKTVYNMESSFAETKSSLDQLPPHFPLPSLNDSLIHSTGESTSRIPSLILNLNILYKQPSFYGYSPYFLNNTTALENAADMKQLLSTPICYFSSNEDKVTSKVYFQQDSLIANKIIQFVPGEMIVELKTIEKGKFVFNQNNYPGWKAFIDDVPAEIYTVNYCAMGVEIPPGKHLIRFEFGSKKITGWLILSSVTFCSLLLFYSILWLGQKRKRSKTTQFTEVRPPF
ncbi:MAG: hypothetical protein IT223_07685 [Crocinitomicaceae bacterium]|nr:hypothetical protein [Crocinitomicaceae bacterium]